MGEDHKSMVLRGVTTSTLALCVCAFLATIIGVTSAGVISAVVPTKIANAPTMNATSITACGVRVNWEVPPANGGKPVLYYTVYATGGGTVHKNGNCPRFCHHHYVCDWSEAHHRVHLQHHINQRDWRVAEERRINVDHIAELPKIHFRQRLPERPRASFRLCHQSLHECLHPKG